MNKRHDNHREHLCQFIVDRRIDLLETIIPFFRQYPMLSTKQQDFEKFARCLELIKRDRHLTAHGLIEIAEIAQTMNRRKSREHLIGILRGQTPAASLEAKRWSVPYGDVGRQR